MKIENIPQEIKIFDYAKNNFDIVQHQLSNIGIKEIAFFDEIGEDWYEWNFQKNLTLLILPKSKYLTQPKEELKQLLGQEYNDLLAFELITGINENNKVTHMYFPTKNIVIAKYNVFYSETALNKFINSISLNGFLPITKEDAEIQDINGLTTEYNNKMIEEKTRDLNNVEQYLDSLAEGYTKELRKKKKILKEIKNAKKELEEDHGRIEEELKKIELLPFVNKVVFSSAIYIEFGDIYITKKIKTGNKEEDGIILPIMEIKKVKIGNIRLLIKNGNITIRNKDVEDYRFPHPHAKKDKCCFGAIETNVITLLQEFKLEELTILLYQWLQSYNEDDCYCRIEEFYSRVEQINK